MSRRNITEEWKLEGEGEPDDQWTLRPAEQNAVSQWQLQDEGAPGGQNDWQPVDYTRTPREPRGNWVLPALVGVALVAVIAYVGWIALERAGLFGPTSPAQEPTPVAAVEPPVEEPLPTQEPLDTPPPPPSPTPMVEAVVEPTPEPSPTPIPLVNLESIVVNTVGGVNARREPSLQGELIQILPEGPTAYLVAADQGEWVQIALADSQLAWVNSQFVQRNSETVLLEEANRRRQAVGLPPLAAPETGEAVPPVEGPSETVVPTETTGLQGPVTITVTVNTPTGLNARETPELGGAIVQLLTVDSAYPAVARTADNQWFQIQLPDRRLAWVAAQFITAAGDIATLSTEPLTEPITLGAAAPITPTQPITPATALTATTPLTATAPVTATGETTPTVTQVANGVIATVTNLAGANARATPDREVDPLQLVQFNTALPVVGRSADNEWVQVTLAEGQLGWVLANTVSLNTDIAVLPIVSP